MASALDGIETGYETKFDYPKFSGSPRVRYLLASVPRTGSTYLSHLLWQTGCLGAPLEYLNFLPGGPYGFVAGQPRQQAELFEKVIRSRTSPNGVFGLKVFPSQLEELMVSNPRLVDAVMRFMLGPDTSRLVLQLRRRDRDAHAISWARAALSGRWRAEQEGEHDVEPEFSPAALAQANAEIERQEMRWSEMCHDLRLQPLVLWYEDVVANPTKALRQVADYTGVCVDDSAAVEVPEIRQQAQDGPHLWARQLSKSEKNG